MFFIVTLKNGTQAIIGRKAKARDILPFYMLVLEVHIKPRLGTQRDVEDTLLKSYKGEWERVWADILRRSVRL